MLNKGNPQINMDMNIGLDMVLLKKKQKTLGSGFGQKIEFFKIHNHQLGIWISKIKLI